MTKKKIYIAGKVTGEPPHKTALKFALAKREIERIGHEAVNPIEVVGDSSCPWNEAMKMCIIALLGCTDIVFLPCWKDSKGAQLEYKIAESLGMQLGFL